MIYPVIAYGSPVLKKEGEDFISAERINNFTYPTYLIVGLKKK